MAVKYEYTRVHKGIGSIDDGYLKKDGAATVTCIMACMLLKRLLHNMYTVIEFPNPSTYDMSYIRL